VDELGHTFGIAGGRPREALVSIDRLLQEALEGFEGEIVLSADHGLTDTDTHLDLRGIVEESEGTTIAYPLITKRFPRAVVCESGNGMANVYLPGENGWAERPPVERCRELAVRLLAIDGIDSVAVRGDGDGVAELMTHEGVGRVEFDSTGLSQSGTAFASTFSGATPAEGLGRSHADRYPDAAYALTSIFASERAGDLLVSARPGFDLRTKAEWPEHHASHGGLHREHTVVPVYSSAALPERPLRTLDVFAHTLELAGVPLEEYPESDAARLARGDWKPEVWR
jgi:Type I phosphodiesterase / nucleotide pyrophosphatase